MCVVLLDHHRLQQNEEKLARLQRNGVGRYSCCLVLLCGVLLLVMHATTSHGTTSWHSTTQMTREHCMNTVTLHDTNMARDTTTSSNSRSQHECGVNPRSRIE